MSPFHWDFEEWERDREQHEDLQERADRDWELLDRLNDYTPRREVECVWMWRS